MTCRVDKYEQSVDLLTGFPRNPVDHGEAGVDLVHGFPVDACHDVLLSGVPPEIHVVVFGSMMVLAGMWVT